MTGRWIVSERGVVIDVPMVLKGPFVSVIFLHSAEHVIFTELLLKHKVQNS